MLVKTMIPPVGKLSEQVLLKRYREERCAQSFRELSDRYASLVYNACLRELNGDRTSAQDCAQMVFILLSSKADKMKKNLKLGGWLYLTARNVSRNYIRKEQRNREQAHAYAEMQGLDSDDQADAWSEAFPKLEKALEKLNPSHRELLIQRYFQRKPFARIAKEQGILEGAARKRLQYAIEKLRKHLSGAGVTLTAAAISTGFEAEGKAAAPNLFTTSFEQSLEEVMAGGSNILLQQAEKLYVPISKGGIGAALQSAYLPLVASLLFMVSGSLLVSSSEASATLSARAAVVGSANTGIGFSSSGSKTVGSASTSGTEATAEGAYLEVTIDNYDQWKDLEGREAKLIALSRGRSSPSEPVALSEEAPHLRVDMERVQQMKDYDVIGLKVKGFKWVPLKGLRRGGKAQRSASATLEKGASVRGRVTDESRRGIPNVELGFMPPHSSGKSFIERFYSDADGYYYADGLESGENRLFIDHASYVRKSLSYELDAHNTKDLNMSMDSGRTITGRLLMPDGTPVVGYEVEPYRITGVYQGSFKHKSVFPDHESNVKTGLDGRFRLEGVSALDSFISVKASRHDSEWGHADVALDVVGDFVQLDDITLTQLKRLDLHFFDAKGQKSNKYIFGYLISSEPSYFGRDVQGHPKNGIMSLYVPEELRGEFYLNNKAYSVSGNEVKIILGEPLKAQKPFEDTAKNEPAFRLEGTVFDQFGNPVGGAEVVVKPYSQSAEYRAFADANGHYHLDQIMGSKFRIEAQKDGFLAFNSVHFQYDALEDEMTQKLKQDLYLYTKEGGHIEVVGKLIDKNGNPMVGMRTYLWARCPIGSSFSLAKYVVLTDNTGVFRFDGLHPGKVKLQLPSNSSLEAEVPSLCRPTTDADLELNPSDEIVEIDFDISQMRSQLSLNVVSSTGEGVNDGYIILRPLDAFGWHSHAAAINQNTAHFPRIAAGRYEVHYTSTNPHQAHSIQWKNKHPQVINIQGFENAQTIILDETSKLFDPIDG